MAAVIGLVIIFLLLRIKDRNNILITLLSL